MGKFLPGSSQSKSSSSYTSSPTFKSPEAQQMLSTALERQTGEQGSTFLDMFRNSASRDPGTGNPFLAELERTQRPQFDRMLQSGLAQIRSGAARGGRGASEMNQAGFIGDATNQYQSNVMSMFADQYNQDLARQAQLVGLEGQREALGLQLLSMLRGEEGTGQARQKGYGAPTWGDVASMAAVAFGSE